MQKAHGERTITRSSPYGRNRGLVFMLGRALEDSGVVSGIGMAEVIGCLRRNRVAAVRARAARRAGLGLTRIIRRSLTNCLSVLAAVFIGVLQVE